MIPFLKPSGFCLPRSFRFRIIFTVLIGPLSFFLSQSMSAAPPSAFSGAAALADTRRATDFGERPPGSPAIDQLRKWIVTQIKPLGGQVTLDSFQAQTPDGTLPMSNIILEFAGTSGSSVMVTGHYDTMRKPMLHFVGANDGGSSTGFLIEFARVVARLKHPDTIYIVFFDGEEAIRQWTDTDSLYGSRHLAAKWGADGTLAHVKAFINVDMIGDKDLDVLNDGNSSQSLRALMWRVADRIGDGKYFIRTQSGIDDDHFPFLQAGVNSLDIIDYDYGPNNAYWHTAKDTMDKLGGHSFQVVGDVVVGMLEELEQSKQ